MAGQGFTVNIRIDGAKQTLAAFRRLPKQASDDLRSRTLQLSQALAQKVATAATLDSPQSALMAPTVAARRDRVPAIVAGGIKKVGRRRVPAFKVLFGSEFGATRLRQYRPHLGRGSYWFFRTIEANEQDVADEWMRVADDVAKAFGQDGD